MNSVGLVHAVRKPLEDGLIPAGSTEKILQFLV